MQQQAPKTSFIPKKSLGKGGGSGPKKKTSRRGPGIFFMLALLILLIAGGGALGVFLYKTYLENSIERKEASLERAREAFDPALIEELSRLDARMKAANTILSQHVAPSLIFNELEQLTLRTVQFSSFSYQAGNEGEATLTMNGEAEGFEAVALQSDAFGESELIEDPVFSNVNLNEEGTVTFDFKGAVPVDALRYTNALNATGNNTPATTTSAGAADDNG